MGTDTGVRFAPPRATSSCPRPPLLGREELLLSEFQTPPEPADPIGEEVARIVRRKARSLVGCAGLTRQDRPDVEQELFLRILGPLRALPPTAAGRLAYAQRLVDRFALNLLRSRRAAKRTGGPVLSLDVPAGGGDAANLGATVGSGERDAYELRGLALDVAAVLERLPDDLRALAVALMGESLTALARRLGVPRSTLRDRLRGVRTRLARENLDEF